jgi:DNA-binding XRE family transcriptional regulator
MGVLEIIAEKHLGEAVLKRNPSIKRCISRLDVAAQHASSQDERERIASIVELCFEYERETDTGERENILRTLEEIVANADIRIPTETIEDFETELARTDAGYKAAAAKEDDKAQRFLKKYSSLKAKAGLATQAEVAKKSGLSRAYVAVVETGQHRPQHKTLQKLAKAFCVDVAELL